MKSLRYLFYILTGICFFTACSEESFTTFNGELSGIYIQRNVSSSTNNDGYYLGTTYADSVNYSFASAGDITQATIPLTIKIMGNIVDYDRPFVLKVDESKTTAIRGTHFDYDESSCVMPANAAQTTVPVTLFRHSDLTTGYYRVEFYLEANDYFTPELEQYKNTDSWTATGDTLCGTRYAIRFSEILTNPGMWWNLYMAEYCGEWTANKETLLNQIMGWTHSDWTGWRVPYGQMAFAAKQLRKMLQEAADAGTPILDADGSYMQLIPPYEVDYSAYN